MKFKAKLEEQIIRYQNGLAGNSKDEALKNTGKIEGLKAALMYFNSLDSWGNVTKKPGRLGSST